MADLLFEQDYRGEENQARRGSWIGSSLNRRDEEKQNERTEGRLHTSFWRLSGTKDLVQMLFRTSEVHDEFHESESEFSLEGGEGIRLVTAFLIKLQSPVTLWVQDASALWLRCIIDCPKDHRVNPAKNGLG
ncbi:hypothetical protein llap_11932 [Limosa lapponica baueri]|uniref:Uncharacterized protein n=1 Tax=Limosa lapponica baueri TaxID=1758121 RepID=A0A2I0TVE3_LIMLA|nr:hypothetical protein llap_11932 [Limosa lapponica baueri]